MTLGRMVGPSEPAGLPPKAKLKAYKVLGDVGEFQERLAATLPPPKAPEPPNVFNISDTSEFPPDVWFAATISPDNGVAVIASYRELCKARCGPAAGVAGEREVGGGGCERRTELLARHAATMMLTSKRAHTEPTADMHSRRGGLIGTGRCHRVPVQRT